jgi:hypothetical protein
MTHRSEVPVASSGARNDLEGSEFTIVDSVADFERLGYRLNASWPVNATEAQGFPIDNLEEESILLL